MLCLARCLIALAPTLPIAAVSAVPAQASGAGAESAREDTPGAARGDAGVEAYRAADFATARDLWLVELERSEVAGRERGRVLYNLGNAAFRDGKLHAAVGWYTAALRYRPRDADTWANLEFARSEAGLEPADRGDLAATVERLVSALTLAESEWVVLGALAVWALLLLGEALRGGRAWRRVAWAGLAFVGLCLAPWLYNLAAVGKERVLVVHDRTTPVLSEPRAGAAQVAKVESGVVIERVDELPEWVKVRAADGTRGWVPRTAVFDLRR